MTEYLIIYRIKGIEGRFAIRHSEAIDCPELAEDLWRLRYQMPGQQFQEVKTTTTKPGAKPCKQ